MVAQMEPLDEVGAATVSVEHTLGASLATMRKQAAEAGTDDYFENWSKEVLDRRPLIVVAALMEGQTMAWVMEPDGDGVLRSGISHLTAADGTPRYLGHAQRACKTTLLDAIAGDVGWLVKKDAGEFLSERD